MKHTLVFVIAPIIFGCLVLLVASWIAWRRLHLGKLKTERYHTRWQELQKLLRDKQQWTKAIFEADKLLDEALKKKRFHGRTMGERMVSAQRMFTDNDGVWFGHKLRNKLEAEPQTKLKETDVKQALVGIRQALKDIGALPS